jgi:hypothetical protein
MSADRGQAAQDLPYVKRYYGDKRPFSGKASNPWVTSKVRR